MKRYRLTNEASLQSAINADLRATNCILWHHDEKGRGRGQRHRKGLPDIVIWVDGETYFLELKQPGCELRPEQAAWFQKAKAMGFYCAKISSLIEWKAVKQIIREDTGVLIGPAHD